MTRVRRFCFFYAAPEVDPMKADQDTIIKRKENCRFCNHNEGRVISVVDYWDLHTGNLVQCAKCSLVQLDPMLPRKDAEKGCFAYYVTEALVLNDRQKKRNLFRNFRKGVAFGCQLKARGITPKNVLEIGPGSGYFSAGLQYVFPSVSVSVMDIVQQVIEGNRMNHGFQGIFDTPEVYNQNLENQYDLIIARDILEHVSHAGDMIQNVYRYLVPGGVFHFITPNGYEDVWRFRLAWSGKRSPAELKINHVNYFDGGGLEKVLREAGFEKLSYYIYGLKYTARGSGWKNDESLYAPVSRKESANEMIEKFHEIKEKNFSKEEILNRWPVSSGYKWLINLYSLYSHHSFLRLPPRFNIGHEIFGLFRKGEKR